MATDIDICNLALANLGHRAEVTSITGADLSQEAALCTRFYPLARDAVLELHPWDFARKRVALTDLTTPPDGWGYRYDYPAGVIRALAVYPDGADITNPDIGEPFAIEADATGTVIYTDAEVAYLLYVAQITDTTVYPALFVQAVAAMLSHFLAGPLTEDKDLAAAWLARALTYAGQAHLTGQSAVSADTRRHIQRRYPISYAGRTW